MANDRTERHNLAAAEPKRLQAMTQRWTDMTRQVLHAPPKFYSRVEAAELPHRHPEWTDFSVEPSESVARRIRARVSRPSAIRARKNTQLDITNGQLQLTFTGDDPGIAIDRMEPTIASGPYRLTFRLSSQATGDGEVFYTTDAKTSLPRGQHIVFGVTKDGQWHEVQLDLDTDGRIHALRLDVSTGSGRATIADLELHDADGKLLAKWPNQDDAN
jgi:arylsulfatase